MTLGTHVAFASVLYLGGATLFGYKPDWIGWLLAVVASLLPDVDLPPARIGRLFWFVSVPLERRFGHRTLTHSAVMLLAVAVLAELYDQEAQWEHETRNPAYDLATKAERELETVRALQEEVQRIREWVFHLQRHRE